jgi:hypothetical protein
MKSLVVFARFESSGQRRLDPGRSNSVVEGAKKKASFRWPLNIFGGLAS